MVQGSEYEVEICRLRGRRATDYLKQAQSPSQEQAIRPGEDGMCCNREIVIGSDEEVRAKESRDVHGFPAFWP